MRREKLAVLLIDMQEGFVRNLSKEEKRRIVRNQQKVLRWCVRMRIPIIVVCYERYGRVIAPLRKQLEGTRCVVRRITKNWNDAFEGTPLADILKNLKITRLFLMGINAVYCVMDTAAGALHNGFSICTSNAVIAGAQHQPKNNGIPWYRKKGIVLPESDLIEKLSTLASQSA